MLLVITCVCVFVCVSMHAVKFNKNITIPHLARFKFCIELYLLGALICYWVLHVCVVSMYYMKTKKKTATKCTWRLFSLGFGVYMLGALNHYLLLYVLCDHE